MSTNESIVSTENKTPSVSPGNYSPVTVYAADTVGAVFLGAFAVIFLAGWLWAEARYRKLLTTSSS